MKMKNTNSAVIKYVNTPDANYSDWKSYAISDTFKHYFNSAGAISFNMSQLVIKRSNWEQNRPK